MERGKRLLLAVFLGLTAVTAAVASGSTTEAATKGTNRVLLKSVPYFQSLQDQRKIRIKESPPSLYKRFLEGDADERVGKDYKKTSLDFKRVRTTKRVPRLKVRKLKQDETKLQKRSLRYSSVQGDSSRHMDMCAYFKSRGITSPAFCRGKQSRIVRIRSQKSFEDHKGDTMENEDKAETYKGDPNPDTVGEDEQTSENVSEEVQQLDKVEDIYIPARLKEIEGSGDEPEVEPDKMTEASIMDGSERIDVTFEEDIESQAETVDASDMNMSSDNIDANAEDMEEVAEDAEDMDEATEDVNEMLNTSEEVLQLTDPSEVSTKPLTEIQDSTSGTLVYQPQFVQAPLYYPPPPLVYNPPVPQCHCHPLCHCHPVPVPHYPTPQSIPYTTSQTTSYPAYPGPVGVKPVYGYTPATLRSADKTSVKKVVTGALAAGAGLALANHFLNRPQQQGYYGRPQQGYYPPQQQTYYPQYPHQQAYYPAYQPARPPFGGGYYYGRSIPETKEAKNTPSNITGELPQSATTSTGLFYYFPSYPYHSYYRPTKTRPIRPVRQQNSFNPFLISTLSKENQSRVKRQAGHEDEKLEEAVETSQIVSNSEELSLTPYFSIVQNINADNTDSELDLPELPRELASTVQIRLEKDNSEVDHALDGSDDSDAELQNSEETEPRHKCPTHQCPEKDEAENDTTGQPRENTMGLQLEEDVILFPGQKIEVLGKPEDEVEGKEDEGTKPKKTKKKNKKKKKPSKGTLAAAGVIAGLGGAALTNYVLKNHFRPQQSQYHPGYYPPPAQHQRPISAYPTIQPNHYQPTYQQPYTSSYPTSQTYPANPTSGYPSQFKPQQTSSYSPSYAQQSFGSGYHSTQSTYPSNQGSYQSYQPTNQAFGQSYPPSWGKGDLGFHPGFIGRTALETDNTLPLARSPLFLISTQTHETPYLANLANSYQSTRYQTYQPQKPVSYFHSKPLGTVVKNAPYKQNLIYFG